MTDSTGYKDMGASIPKQIRVAIVHYHLRTGGVTTVIDHACEALNHQNVQPCILVGETPDKPSMFRVPVHVVPGLSYDHDRTPTNPDQLAQAMTDACAKALGGQPDVWHVHNHSLGKNVALPAALARMAQRNERIVFQIHDFAEDGRPNNYQHLRRHLQRDQPSADSPQTNTLGQALYPHGPTVHYAAINNRDQDQLLAAGLPTNRLHLLPNAIKPFPADEASTNTSTNASLERPSSTGLRIVYPTRAIRRKNLGELLLWATCSRTAGRDDHFFVTRAPQNPQQRPAYDRWVNLAAELDLPVSFETGDKSGLRYVDLLRQADALITTSIAEGFGMIYLEPWLVGKPLFGRRLPEITRSIEDRGIQLTGLYDRLLVPLDWINVEELAQSLRVSLAKAYESFGRSWPSDLTTRALDHMTHDGRVDFGQLNEPLQESIIRRLIQSPNDRSTLSPSMLFPEDHSSAQDIEHNRNVTLDAFSLESYGQRLRAIYDDLLAAKPGPLEALNAGAVLDQFLAPERFNLLLT